MDSKKIILKYFLIFFFSFFLIFNWQKISWIFYPKYLWRTFSFYLFEKKEEENQLKEIKETKEIKKENELKNENNNFKENSNINLKKDPVYQKDSIEIKKIGILAPLISVSKEEEIKKMLDKGAVLWPKSVLPGEKGQTIILGHSAPPHWPKVKYDWIFSNLNSLEKGDEIVIYFQNKKYIYIVENKIFLKKGEEVPPTDSTKSILFLISCWPPGKDLKRIAIEAILKE